MLQSTRRWLITTIVVVMSGLSFHGGLDRVGEAYLERAMTQAVAAFAIARGINAVISVAKGSEVSVEPFGVGVSLAVGEILDPVDDLVERFSWVMLLAIVALGVQKLLLALGGTLAVNAFIALLALATLLVTWRPVWFGPRTIRAVVGLFVATLVLRFVMVAVALASDAVHAGLIGEEVDRATTELTAAESRLTQLADEAEESDARADQDSVPWWSRLDELWTEEEAASAPQPVEQRSSWDPRARLEALQMAAADTVDHLLSLAAAFVTQTVLLPILFLWLALKLSGLLLAGVGAPWVREPQSSGK